MPRDRDPLLEAWYEMHPPEDGDRRVRVKRSRRRDCDPEQIGAAHIARARGLTVHDNDMNVIRRRR